MVTMTFNTYGVGFICSNKTYKYGTPTELINKIITFHKRKSRRDWIFIEKISNVPNSVGVKQRETRNGKFIFSDLYSNHDHIT